MHESCLHFEIFCLLYLLCFQIFIFVAFNYNYVLQSLRQIVFHMITLTATFSFKGGLNLVKGWRDTTLVKCVLPFNFLHDWAFLYISVPNHSYSFHGTIPLSYFIQYVTIKEFIYQMKALDSF